MAKPTRSQSEKWGRFKNRVRKSTIPKVKAVIIIAQLATDAQKEVERLTGSIPDIVTTEDEYRVGQMGHRAQILERLVHGVILHKYQLNFLAGNLNIVSNEQNEKDVFPLDTIKFGLHPVIVVAGIAAFTLLIAGDQATDRLEHAARLQAVKLQRDMVKADRFMAQQPKPIRDQWTRWKKSAAERAKKAAKAIGADKSWLEKFIGSKGTMAIVIALIIGVAIFAGMPGKLKEQY